MKRALSIGVSLCCLLVLGGCKGNTSNNNLSEAISSSGQIAKNKSAIKLSNAEMDVDSLFDNEYTKLSDGIDKEQVDLIKKEVVNLPSSSAKTKLQKHLSVAYKLLPALLHSESVSESKKAVKDEIASSKAAIKESKQAISESKATAESESVAESKASESKALAASEASSKIAESKAESLSTQKTQKENKATSISMVDEMYTRIDGVDGISEKVIALSKSPSDNLDKIKKEIIVLKNVVSECDGNYANQDDYPAGFSSALNDFWSLSAEILNVQKGYLKYLINETDVETMSGKAYLKKVNSWDKIYKEIVRQ